MNTPMAESIVDQHICKQTIQQVHRASDSYLLATGSIALTEVYLLDLGAHLSLHLACSLGLVSFSGGRVYKLGEGLGLQLLAVTWL